MAWTLLVVAGLLEIVWATSLKFAAGFTKPGPTVLTIGAMIASFLLLGRATRSLPLGVAYSVWVGIGAVGATLAGRWLLSERLTPAQGVCLAFIVAGVIGLKVLTPGASTAG